MDSWIVTLSLVVILLTALYHYIRYKQRFFERLGIPHLKPTFLVGNQGAVILRKRSIFEQVRWLYDQVQNVRYVGFYDFMTPTIIIKDPELLRELTIKHFDNFTDHADFALDIDPLFSKNLFQLHGQKWREYRTMLSPSFTAAKLKGMFNLINKCALDFNEYLSNLNKEAGAGPIDTKDLFTRYTNDVIASAAFGIEVNSLKERNNEFYKFGRQATTFDYIRSMKIFFIKSFPRLARLCRIKLLNTETSNYFINLIKNNVNTRETQGITRLDMIQLMLQAREEAKGKVEMDIVEMTAQAFIFFFAGFETTSTAMCFAAHQIASHPEIQERLVDEIKKRYAAINNVSTGYEAFKEFHYLDAVVSETLRMFAPVLAVDRVCVKRFELPPATPGGKPVVIEPGTVIWIPVIAMHYDKQHHEEPGKFRPERFLDSEGNIAVKVTDSATFIPFGIGPRMCIASRFALLEIKLVLTHLLAKCHLSVSERTPNPLDISRKSFLMSPVTGFWLQLKPRETEGK